MLEITSFASGEDAIMETENNNTITIKRIVDGTYGKEHFLLLKEVDSNYRNKLINLSWFRYGEDRTYSVSVDSESIYTICNGSIVCDWNGGSGSAATVKEAMKLADENSWKNVLANQNNCN